ncbi:hypothetical protein HBB16_02905 [Pseudonocardia sp. MCCB 268]|nr:hypothetical protein [Pseudonocardia cytotoxica]
MITVYLNCRIGDDDRRESLFRGNFFLYYRRCGRARRPRHDLISQAFEGWTPSAPSNEMDVDEFIRRVEPLKGESTNGQRTGELCQQFAIDLGVDPERTYFDILRLRVIRPTVPHRRVLTTTRRATCGTATRSS